MKLSLTKLILIFLVLGINVLVFKDELVKGLTSWRGQNLVSDVRIGKRWQNFDKFKTEAVAYSGWSQKNIIDLSLDPQANGLAIYRFDRPEAAKVVVLQLALFYPSLGSNKVSLSTDQINWQVIAENARYHLVPIDISRNLADSQQFWVKFEASNQNPQGQDQQPVEILYDFNLMFYRQEIKIPRLDLILLTVFLPLLFVFGPKFKTAFKLTLLLLVFSLGLHLALKNLSVNRYHSFDSDILCLTSAVPKFISADPIMKIFGPYCTEKESGVMLITFGLWPIFGYGSEIAIKFSSLLFHLLTIIFVFWYGWKIRSFTVGLTAALFLSLHPYLIELSGRGLRDSAFGLATLIFAYCLFVSDLKLFRNKIFMFLAAVFVVYIRSQSIFQFIGMALVAMVYQRTRIKSSLIVIFGLLLLVLPLRLMSLKVFQAWNYAGISNYKWMVNVEFAGEPGFPSKESARLDSRQGQAVSATTYFFKLHTFSDLVISTLKGVNQTFSNLYFKKNFFGFIFFIIGGWLMLKNKYLWYIPFLVFFLELPHFFMVQKNLLEFRSMTHSLPFIALTIGYIIDRIWKKLKPY